MDKKIPKAAGSGPLLIKPASWQALLDAVQGLDIIPDPKDFNVSKREGKKFLSLRPPNTPSRPGPPLVPPFTLSASATGARVYKGVLEWAVTTLNFERLQIKDADGELLEEVNNFTGQDEITGVEMMERNGESGSEEAEDSWWDLSWWGDVWAKVVLDPESGHPLSWELVGPEKPEMQSIAQLSEDLSRGSGAGSDGAEEIGFSIRIGSVPEEGAIIQDRTGNLQWFCAFVPENPSSMSSEASSSEESSSESSSSESSSSEESSSDASSQSSGGSSQSSGGSSGASSGGGGSSAASESEKSSNAIVEAPWTEGKFVALATLESNQVLFEFIVRDIKLAGPKTRVKIDPRFVYVCEPNSLCVAAAPCGDAPFAVGAKVEKGVLTLTALTRADRRPKFVNVRLTGIRKGFQNWDMPSRTAKQKKQSEAARRREYDR
jgi:uncharacterized membrane protein YgcG